MSKTASTPQLQPEPEVEQRPKRRTYTGQYKAKILEEGDAATEPGPIRFPEDVAGQATRKGNTVTATDGLLAGRRVTKR